MIVNDLDKVCLSNELCYHVFSHFYEEMHANIYKSGTFRPGPNVAATFGPGPNIGAIFGPTG